MNLNLDELESAPATKSGRGGLVVLLIGIALGVAGTLLVPRYVMPLLPDSLRGGGEHVDGVVLAMGRDGDKLLVTVDTPKGAVLATFTQRVAEVELLVRVGDTLTLGMDRYDPFVNDPDIAAVRKDRSGAGASNDAAAGADAEAADMEGADMDAADTAAADMGAAEMDAADLDAADGDAAAEPVQPDTADLREQTEPGTVDADTTQPGTESAVEEAGAAAD